MIENLTYFVLILGKVYSKNTFAYFTFRNRVVTVLIPTSLPLVLIDPFVVFFCLSS